VADKTIGFKVSEDLHEKAQMMIEASGLSNKEWFDKVVSLAEINDLKEGAGDYKQDLAELEAHTTRIYKLIANMVQRSIYLKDQETGELQEKIDQKDSVIGEYQQQVQAAKDKVQEMEGLLESVGEENESLQKNIEEIRSSNENNIALIAEYKEKIDTLSGLVNEYKSFQEENVNLKQEFAGEKEKYESQISELMEENEINQDLIKELNGKVENLTEKYEADIEQLKERKEIEKEKAILETERKYNNEIARINSEHTEKISSLYEEVNTVRKGYEERINQLQDQHKAEIEKYEKGKD